MKSYVSFLQGLYGALLSSIAEYDPTLRRDCVRDLSRLLSLVDARGLSYLMIDLPAMGKHLDQCLAMERLTSSGIAGFRPYCKRSTIPRLFKGMWLRVFDDVGMLRADADAVMIRSLRQLLYAAKKVKVPCSDSRTWKQVHEFFQIDREIRSPSLNWDEDEFRIDDIHGLHIGDHDLLSPAPLLDLDFTHDQQRGPSPHLDDRFADAVQRTADIVSATIGRFNPSEWRTKHGPGAVADQRHTQFKYDFPNWPSKLESVFPMADFGFANYAAWVDFLTSENAHKGFSPHEPPSRLIAVPKTLKGPRLIAAEPVSHQWCQQSILDFLTSSLSKTPIAQSIHFRDQRFNQDLAKKASHTQSHATIDLSSASDRLSCWLVERIFRRNPTLVAALHATRTRWVENSIDCKSPKFHKLRKFACMGSACTFPVQSYVFAVLAIASVLYERGSRVTIASVRSASREVLVFGDDIIVPIDSADRLQGLLGNLGLEVNRSKTFYTGRFRESCGLDAWNGSDVTPTYTITYPDVSRPESITSSVATHNNFVSRRLYVAADYVKSQVRRLGRMAIANVPVGSGAFGWFDHAWSGNDHLKRRFNPRSQLVEIRCTTDHSEVRRKPTEGGSQLLQYFTEVRPVDYIVGDRIGVVGRARTSLRTRWVPESRLQ
ncbi:MAG: putative replicase protein [Alehxovirus pseudonemorisenecus]|uniref:RNA-directed RNA polymerase n=1 Tax=Leviviridae sp. TaxID=2027243 RepID=A0ABY3ST80_9VIRU|nr:MAG: putative replicase protein [Leviviridae sp.]